MFKYETKRQKTEWGGGERSSSITLNGINEKVRTAEGSTRVTPITMSDLDNRIDALGGKGKFAIRTISGGVIPTEFIGWDFLILQSSRMYASNGLHYIENNGKTIRAERNSSAGNASIFKTELFVENNIIKIYVSQYATHKLPDNSKVLFYTGTGY